MPYSNGDILKQCLLFYIAEQYIVAYYTIQYMFKKKKWLFWFFLQQSKILVDLFSNSKMYMQAKNNIKECCQLYIC